MVSNLDSGFANPPSIGAIGEQHCEQYCERKGAAVGSLGMTPPQRRFWLHRNNVTNPNAQKPKRKWIKRDEPAASTLLLTSKNRSNRTIKNAGKSLTTGRRSLTGCREHQSRFWLRRNNVTVPMRKAKQSKAPKAAQTTSTFPYT